MEREKRKDFQAGWVLTRLYTHNIRILSIPYSPIFFLFFFIHGYFTEEEGIASMCISDKKFVSIFLLSFCFSSGKKLFYLGVCSLANVRYISEHLTL